MKIPDDIFLQFTLKVGSVYYYLNPEIENSDEPHYRIVLSHDENGRILLVGLTTKIAKRELFIKRRNFPRETFVRITPSSSNGLTQESGVDCNYVFEQTEGLLAQIYKENYVKYKGVLADDDLARLILGVQRSPLVSPDIKKLL